MTAYDDALNTAIGTRGDVVAAVRNLWFYDFDGYPIRIWQGHGRLFTVDGQEWLGSQTADGTDFHLTPQLSDGRDLTSRLLEFSLGYLDAGTYNALRADRWRAEGRTITHHECLFLQGEGLRPQTPLNFVTSLDIVGLPRFEESQQFDGTAFIRRRKIIVNAKDDNAGRSFVPGRTMTDAGQKAHALFYGIAVDKGAERVAQNANRVIKIG